MGKFMNKKRWTKFWSSGLASKQIYLFSKTVKKEASFPPLPPPPPKKKGSNLWLFQKLLLIIYESENNCNLTMAITNWHKQLVQSLFFFLYLSSYCMEKCRKMNMRMKWKTTAIAKHLLSTKVIPYTQVS